MEQDHARLWEAARSGDLSARVAMALHYLESGRVARGLKWLREAAAAGSTEALFSLGRELRSGARTARDLPAAREAFESAAEAGDAAAAFELSGLMFLGLGGPEDRAAAAAMLARAASAGHAPALRTLGLIHAMNGADDLARQALACAGEGIGAGEEIASFDWPQPPAFKTEQISESPMVAVVRGFLSGDECDYLIEHGAPALRQAQTADPATGQATTSQVRTGSDMGFGPDRLDIVVRLIEERMAAACGIPREHGEPLVLLHYAPGQEYKDHFDFLGPGDAESEREARFGGQRVVTFLVYLNDVEAGGATEFPRAKLSVRGNRGDALFFRNVTGAGEPDLATLHRGAPVKAGEKWLASKWIRERPHPDLS